MDAIDENAPLGGFVHLRMELSRGRGLSAHAKCPDFPEHRHQWISHDGHRMERVRWEGILKATDPLPDGREVIEDNRRIFRPY
jgi:hypothetical protein